MKRFLVLLGAVSVLFAGCATIVSGTKQKVKISANPEKAEVVITSDKTGQEFYKGAPGDVKLPKNTTYTVAVSMEGYATQKVILTRSFNGWVVGNLCFGGIPGGVVDLLTGAFWKLEPNNIDITLQTALLDTEDGPVLVFFATDEDGELRSLAVPMIKA
jgi:hypothetical protein